MSQSQKPLPSSSQSEQTGERPEAAQVNTDPSKQPQRQRPTSVVVAQSASVQAEPPSVPVQNGAAQRLVSSEASVNTPQNVLDTRSVLSGAASTPNAQPLNISLGIRANQPTQGAPGGVVIPERGVGLLTTATPTSMLPAPLGNSVGLAAGHMMSHDQSDDAVFSPGIVDDERMKLLERVSFTRISYMYL